MNSNEPQTPLEEAPSTEDIPGQTMLSFAPRRCPSCSRREGKDVFKPVTDFYPNKGRADGYSVHCRACQRRFSVRTYHKRNPNSKKNLLNLKDTLITAGELHPDTPLSEVLEARSRAVIESPATSTAKMTSDILSGLAALGITPEPLETPPAPETRQERIARLKAELADLELGGPGPLDSDPID